MNKDVSKALRIVNSYNPTIFKPAGFPFSNPHYQTIVGSEVIRDHLLGNYPRNFECVRERFDTPDGDIFYADFTKTNPDSKYIVVILHGLESHPKSPLVTKMATAFHSKGFNCCLLTFRGCSGEENLTPGGYHLGFTNDLDQLTKFIHKNYPDKKIFLSGFSLGGNVILKFLGELETKAIDRNIVGAAVTCVPFDPVASQYKLDQGFNRAVYSMNFLRTLITKAERQHSRFPGAFDIDKVRNCTTIGEFDDAFIAKIYNFEDKIDYYRKSGSKWWLKNIRVATIAINALDDPFIEETSLPSSHDLLVSDEDDSPLAPVRLYYTNYGGHCGFISPLLSSNIPSHGWLAEELSRALLHISKNL